MPTPNPTACAVFAMCGMKALGKKLEAMQRKNQISIMVTMDECKYKPEPGSNFPLIQM
jgi:hypothetical protein